MYDVSILADSVASGVRLTTMQVTFPRIVLAEFNTHRMFSRNSASSRAIPIEKRIKTVLAAPFIPEAFAANKKGMQAGEKLSSFKNTQARILWLTAMYASLACAWMLSKVGVHKQWANRLVEPFSWTTVIVTATEWENFFNLRTHTAAQPEIRKIAEMMKAAYEASIPVEKKIGEWHLPLIFPADMDEMRAAVNYTWLALARVSAARCARVSYLTHDGVRDMDADLMLYSRLQKSGHMSPMEHAAAVGGAIEGFQGNFRLPWISLRKMLPGEDIYRGQ